MTNPIITSENARSEAIRIYNAIDGRTGDWVQENNRAVLNRLETVLEMSLTDESADGGDIRCGLFQVMKAVDRETDPVVLTVLRDVLDEPVVAASVADWQPTAQEAAFFAPFKALVVDDEKLTATPTYRQNITPKRSTIAKLAQDYMADWDAPWNDLTAADQARVSIIGVLRELDGAKKERHVDITAEFFVFGRRINAALKAFQDEMDAPEPEESEPMVAGPVAPTPPEKQKMITVYVTATEGRMIRDGLSVELVDEVLPSARYDLDLDKVKTKLGKWLASHSGALIDLRLVRPCTLGDVLLGQMVSQFQVGEPSFGTSGSYADKLAAVKKRIEALELSAGQTRRAYGADNYDKLEIVSYRWPKYGYGSVQADTIEEYFDWVGTDIRKSGAVIQKARGDHWLPESLAASMADGKGLKMLERAKREREKAAA